MSCKIPYIFYASSRFCSLTVAQDHQPSRAEEDGVTLVVCTPVDNVTSIDTYCSHDYDMFPDMRSFKPFKLHAAWWQFVRREALADT